MPVGRSRKRWRMKGKVLAVLAAFVGSLGLMPVAAATEPVCTERPQICLPERICVEGRACVVPENADPFPGDDPCDGEPTSDRFWCPFTGGVNDVLYEQDVQCEGEVSYVDLAVCTIEDTLP